MGDTGIFERLRDDILTCALAPGVAIYEQELAQRFGMSKSPVRDALSRLQEQNLVEVRARSGYRVKPISIAEASEIYEMRQLYERACVSLAIDHATDQQIDDLSQHLTTDPYMHIVEWIALNKHFHSAIAMVCGNARLANAANALNDEVNRFTFVSIGRLQQPISFARLNKEHAALQTAMRTRNKRTALSILRTHIEASRQRTMQALANSVVVP